MIFGPLGSTGGGGSFQIARGRSTSTTQIQVGFKPMVVMVAVCSAAPNSVLDGSIVFVRPTDSDSYDISYQGTMWYETGTVTFTDDGVQLTGLNLPSAEFYYWFAIG